MESLGSGFSLGLSVSLAVNAATLGFEKIEIVLRSNSLSAASHCWNEMMFEVLPRLICFIVASILSFLGHGDNSHLGHENSIGSVHVFFCVASIMLCSHVLAVVCPLCLEMAHLLPKADIPFHYQRIAHRYGEWVSKKHLFQLTCLRTLSTTFF
jgi:hypothetical protein